MSKKIALLICAIVLTGITVACFLNIELINAYYKDFKNNPFKKGAKVYAYDPFAAMPTSKLLLLRIAKSKNGSQYLLLKPGTAFTNDSLYKYKSSYIGNYIKRTIIPIHANDTTVYVSFYAIKPFKRALSTQPMRADTLPEGYEYIDDNLYYVSTYFVEKETTKFYDFR